MQEKDGSQHDNVVTRVARLALVQSSYQLFSLMYRDVKTLHPLVESVCATCERGVQAMCGAAILGASPVLTLVAPQIAMVNDAALRVVVELEERLPVLDEPVDEVVSDLFSRFVNGVSEVTVRAEGLLQRTLTLPRSVYEATTTSVLGVRELVTLGAELVMSRAEDFIEYHFPGEDGRGGAQDLELSGEEQLSDSGLVSRLWTLVGTISTRSLSRLAAFLDPVWSLCLPAQLKRFCEAIMEGLTVENISKKDAKRKETLKKNQERSSLGQAQDRRRLNPPEGSASAFRVFSSNKRVFMERGGGRVRTLAKSLEGFSNPSEIQED